MSSLLLVIDLQRPWPQARATDVADGQGSVAALHDQVMQVVGGSDAWPPAWLQGEWWRERRLDALRPRFAAARAEIVGSGLPVVRDPRLAFTLPLWQEIDPKARVLLLCGAPWGSDTPDLQRLWLARWEAFHAAALRHSQALERRIWHQADPAAVRGIVAWIETWQEPRPLPPEFVAWLETRVGAGMPADGAGLSPSQALLFRGLQEIDPAGAADPGISPAVITGALRAACVQMEEGLFTEALSLHESIGRSREAVAVARRAVADLEQALSELESRRTELRRELGIARSQAEALRGELKNMLGDWCALDESFDVGVRMQETLRTVDAVRRSWTWRLVRLLTLPARVLHRLYLATLVWRRAEQRAAPDAAGPRPRLAGQAAGLVNPPRDWRRSP